MEKTLPSPFKERSSDLKDQRTIRELLLLRTETYFVQLSMTAKCFVSAKNLREIFVEKTSKKVAQLRKEQRRRFSLPYSFLGINIVDMVRDSNPCSPAFQTSEKSSGT